MMKTMLFRAGLAGACALAVARPITTGAASAQALRSDASPKTDLRAPSRGPKAWRPDQLQKFSHGSPPEVADPTLLAGAIPVIMAGSAAADPADSPARRVDENSSASSFAGVCSLLIQNNGSFLCSGTPISRRHILSAAHCVDIDDTGTLDFGVEITVHFNATGTMSHQIDPSGIAAMQIHPDFSGFNNPGVHDDLLLITLVNELPAEIPHYPVFRGELSDGERVTLVGYGDSGFGTGGPYVDSSLSVKRTGVNLAERFFPNDESGEAAIEVWQADFDGPNETANCMGGTTLGNDAETSLAPGDSGGAALVEVFGEWQLWGVNTFIQPCFGPATRFGGVSGGLTVNAYLPWIDLIVECADNCGDCDANGVPDGIDILNGTLEDHDGNNFPDICANILADDIWFSDFSQLYAFSKEAQQIVTESSPNLQVNRLTIAPDGSIVAAGRANFTNLVARLDPLTAGMLEPLIPPAELRGAPQDIVFSDDGYAYVAYWPSFDSVASVSRHNAVTGAFIDLIIDDDPATPDDETGGMRQPSMIAIGPDDRLYIADQDSPDIRMYDRHTGAFLGVFTTIPNVFANQAIRFHGGLLWVCTRIPGDLRAFDLQSGKLIHHLTQPAQQTSWSSDFGFDREGRLIVLTAGFNSGIRAFDAETGDLLETLLLVDFPIFPMSMVILRDQGTPHQPDVDNDGMVSLPDLMDLLAAWGACEPDCIQCPGDITGDCTVNLFDLLALLESWG